MNLKQVQAFLAAARTLNFTRAAEEMFISQQAISKLIIDLEIDLGITLFSRSKGGIALTDEGRYISNMFYNQIQTGKHLLDELRLEKKKRERHFRFGYSTWINPFGEIDRGLTALLKENPDVLFSGCLHHNETLANMLLADELDIAIIPEEQLFGDELFEYRKFAEQDFCLYVPEDVEGEVPDRYCWGLPLLVVASWNWGLFEWKRMYDQELLDLGITPQSVRMLPNVQSILVQLESARCVAILDRRFGIGATIPGIKPLPLPIKATMLTCVWHRDNESPLIEKFTCFLTDFYRNG